MRSRQEVKAKWDPCRLAELGWTLLCGIGTAVVFNAAAFVLNWWWWRVDSDTAAALLSGSSALLGLAAGYALYFWWRVP